jgi:2-polyprenyl-6-methoxyphenol hydroxylase-like FAD-dependent oxidoreductase
VGADGVNSVVRRAHAEAFGSTVTAMNNWFGWFGTTKCFDTLTQTFCRSKEGCFTAHHYRYAPDMSTFLIEVDPDTFRNAGFRSMGEGEAMALCEDVFREALDGHCLVSNRSIWRRFPKVTNQRWSYKKYVLLGDALHTAHFSIGSGTRLAMEDAVALERALNEYPADLTAALKSYEARRRPDLEKLVDAADASAAWYENFPKHMRLAPEEFAMSYITRSGRVDLERLRQLSPAFVAQYERAGMARRLC